MKDFRNCVEREIRREIREMRNSMSFMNEKLEEMKIAFQSTNYGNAQLKEDNATLKRECEDLRKRLLENECRVTQCEQYSRKCNLEIKGIPGGSGGDVFDIVEKICDLVNENITKDDVEFCHRVPILGNSDSANIVVQFAHVAKRNAFLEKAKVKQIKYTDVGFFV